MIVKLKSLLGDIYSFNVDLNIKISDLIKLFYNKYKREITKIVYNGSLVDFNLTIQESKYNNSDNFMIILFNKKIENSNSESDEDIIKKIYNKNIDKSDLSKLIYGILNKNIDLKNKHFGNDTNLEDYESFSDEDKKKLTDINILTDILEKEINEKSEVTYNDFLNGYEFNDEDMDKIDSLSKLGFSEDEVINTYIFTQKNLEITINILMNNKR
jgi:hypothetical protein